MPLDELHRQVAVIALRTAAGYGFALGGGNALIQHGVISRPTQDADLFTGHGYRPRGALRLNAARDVAREPTWSPTELGEQVFVRFREAGTELPAAGASGSLRQQD